MTLCCLKMFLKTELSTQILLAMGHWISKLYRTNEWLLIRSVCECCSDAVIVFGIMFSTNCFLRCIPVVYWIFLGSNSERTCNSKNKIWIWDSESIWLTRNCFLKVLLQNFELCRKNYIRVFENGFSREGRVGVWPCWEQGDPLQGWYRITF